MWHGPCPSELWAFMNVGTPLPSSEKAATAPTFFPANSLVSPTAYRNFPPGWRATKEGFVTPEAPPTFVSAPVFRSRRKTWMPSAFASL